MTSKKLNALVAFSLVTAIAAQMGSTVFAAGVTVAPLVADIVVTNNVAIADNIKVKSVKAKDIVKIYDEAGTILLGTGTVVADGDYTVALSKQFTDAKVKVSLTNFGGTESDKTEVDVPAEAVSTALDAADVTPVNNVGKADTIAVKDLTAKDVVKVYDEAGTTVLGTGTSTLGGVITITLKSQIADDKVNVSVVNYNKKESIQTEVAVADEAETAAPSLANIVASDYVTTVDTVVVKSLKAKDIVKIYAMDSVTVLGTTTMKADGDATVAIKGGLSDYAQVLVSVKGDNALECDNVVVDVPAQVQSTALSAGNITLVNNVSIAPTITVKSCALNDVIRIYKEDGTTLIGTALIKKAGDNVISLPVATGFMGEAKVQLSVASFDKTESTQTEVAVPAKAQTVAPTAGNITVTHNVAIAPTVLVKSCAVGDVVKVYKEDGTTLLASVTVKAAGDATVALPISTGFAGETKVQVSVTNSNKLESTQTEMAVPAKAQTVAPTAGNITVTNNVIINPTVLVKNCLAKDVIKVYKEDGTTLLASITAKAAGDVTVLLPVATGFAGEVKVQVSVTNYNKLESTQTEMAVAAQVQTVAPTAGNIVVTNNVTLMDTVVVKGCAIKDTIKVYAADGTTLIGSAIAAKAGDVTVNITKGFGANANVKVSLINYNKLESTKTQATVAAEAKNTAPTVGNITVNNNVAIVDTVVVKNCVLKDVVKVYAADGVTLIGAATATKAGDVTVNVIKGFKANASVFVSVTSYNSKESDKTEAVVSAEASTTAPAVGKLVVAASGTKYRTLTVQTVKAKDIVKVYAADGKTLIAKGVAVADGNVVFTMLKAKLAKDVVLKVTVTNYNCNESAKTTLTIAS